MKRSDARRLATILFLTVAFATPPYLTHAQVLYGVLVGGVEDPSRAVLPGATVTATNRDTGLQRETTTDGSGSYAFRDLQAGTYDLRVSMSGFKSYVKTGVPVTLNNVAREDVRMEVGGTTETVTVTATAVLQTMRADVSAQLDTAEVSNLPIGSGRNFQQLYKLIPGASLPVELHSDAGNPQRSLGTNFNGVSRSNNNTRLDGATVSYPWLPHIMAYVPAADAVETVNIVTNSFDAEQGMAGGAAVSVSIKSGTNQFHGSGQWFHTNSALRARNYFFVGPEIPKNIMNQFGGTFGGPIRQNKLFFFGNWERTTRRQSASAFRTIPSDALRNGDFSGTGALIYDPATGSPDGTGRQLFPNNRIPAERIDPAARQMIQLIPAPNVATFPNNYFATGTYEFDRDNLDFKVNYNPGAQASVFARYSFSPSDLFDPPSLEAAGGDALAGGQPGRAPGLIQSAAVGGTYTISEHVLVDANFGFTRQRLGAENIDIDRNYGLDVLGIPGTNGPDRLQGGYPRFVINGFSSIGNPNVSNPFQFRDNQYVAVGNLSWLKGSHWFRFGGEYTYYTINHFQPQAAFGPRGGFTFTGGLTALRGGAAPTLYNSFADFLLGLPQSMGKDLQFVNPASVRMPSWGFYARDQWQINRKLTLNYGLRYEYYPFATRADRGGERYDPVTDKVFVGGLGNVPTDAGVDVGNGQLAPRLGVAYRVSDKTVARAGYGISIDPNSFRNLRDAYPATISSQFSGASTLQAAGSLRTGIPEVPVPDLSQGVIQLPTAVGTQTFPAIFDRGYIQSFNVTVQHELGARLVAQAAYVGSRAIRQTANVNINAAGPGGGNNGRALFPQFGRIANINMLTPFNSATYDSLQMQLTRHVATLRPGRDLHLLEGDQLRRQQRLGADLELAADVGSQSRAGRLRPAAQPPDLRDPRAAVRTRQAMADRRRRRHDRRRLAGQRRLQRDERHPVHGDLVRHVAERARQHADGRSGHVGGEDSWRGRPRQQLLRSKRVRAGDRRQVRKQRPQHAARPGPRQPGREPVPGFPAARRVEDAVPRRSVQRHQHAGVQQPGRECVSSDAERGRHDHQPERLHRDHVRPGDGETDPVRVADGLLRQD